MSDNIPAYRIVRFRFNREPETIKEHLTLEEAQTHCGKPETHGDGWFDGYDHMKGFNPR